jgi:hypothetical protein
MRLRLSGREAPFSWLEFASSNAIAPLVPKSGGMGGEGGTPRAWNGNKSREAKEGVFRYESPNRVHQHDGSHEHVSPDPERGRH